MNEFDQRWKLAAALHGRADGPDEAPLGFATRVVALARSAPERSMIAVWQQLAWRVLGGVAAALALAIAAHVTLDSETDSLTPDEADTVPELVWLL